MKTESNERAKLNKIEDAQERENAFYTLYGVKTQKEILEQFKAKVVALKVVPTDNNRMKKENRDKLDQENYQEQYTKLLELVLEYSHAIFFLYSKWRINKNLTAYRKVAIESIHQDNVKKAFELIKRLRDYQEPTEEPREEPITVVDNDCLALKHIEDLKGILEEGNPNVRVDQKDDKLAYIRFAIVSLATGATASEIIDSLVAEEKKSIYDTKYINKLISEIREYQKKRTVGKKKKQTALTERGVRNGVEKLNIPISKTLYIKIKESNIKRITVLQKKLEGTKKEDEKEKIINLIEKMKEDPTSCRNFNDFCFLYNECHTSSPQ